MADYPIGLSHGLSLRPGLEQRFVILRAKIFCDVIIIYRAMSLTGRKVNENLNRKMKIEQMWSI